jgi:putative peptidoglycan lipid II flippase
VLTPFFGIYALAVGVVLGAAGLVATQLKAVRQSGLWSPVLDWRDPAVAETLKLMAPRALGLGVTQLVFFVNTFFCQSLSGDAGKGALTEYTFAFTALQIPVGLVGVPLGIVLLPPLSQAIARGDNVRFRTLVDQSLRMLLFVVVPMTGVMFALGTPIMSVLYQHGKITSADIGATTPVFLIFLVGLVAHVLIALLAPIFYSSKDTRTPVLAALLAVVVDVGAAALLFPAFELGGLALAISLGAWAEVGMLAYFMERRIGFDLKPLAYHSAAFVAGGIVASAACLLAFQTADRLSGWSEAFLMRIVQIGVGGSVAVVVYIGWAWVFKLPELYDSMQLVLTLLRRTPGAKAE